MPAESSTNDAQTPRVDARSPAGAVSRAWPYALILCIGCLILLPQLGSFGFWDPWEPKYVESVREMLERDSYFIPYYRDEVRLTKPILTYWGILAGSAVFGLNELGARIVGVLFAVGSMLILYYAVSRLRGRRAGLLSALILGTSPLFYFLARQATPDIYLLTSLGSAWALFGLALFGPARRRTLHYVASYACFALAVLAKGPIVAGALFFGPLIFYALVRADTVAAWLPGSRADRLRLLRLGICAVMLVPAYAAAVIGILHAAGSAAPRFALLSVATAGAVVAVWALVREASRIAPDLGRRCGRQVLLFAVTVLVVAGPWHLVVFFFQEASYLADFIVKHNVRRIGTEINSSGIADFYLRPMIFGLFPWSCFLPLTLLPLFRRRAGEQLRERGLEIFLVLAAVVTFVAFSIPVTKFPYYLAPILIPAATLIGISLDDLLRARREVIAKVAALVALLLYLPPMVDLLREGNVKYLIGSFTVKRFVPDASAAGVPFAVLLVSGAILLAAFALFARQLQRGDVHPPAQPAQDDEAALPIVARVPDRRRADRVSRPDQARGLFLHRVRGDLPRQQAARPGVHFCRSPRLRHRRTVPARGAGAALPSGPSRAAPADR